MIDERSIQQMAHDEVKRVMAEYEAARRPPTPTPEQQASRELREAIFREKISGHALLHGVKPSAVRFVVREAADVFALENNQLVPKHRQTDPGDPLEPLSPRAWLEQLAQIEPFLFAPPGRSH